MQLTPTGDRPRAGSTARRPTMTATVGRSKNIEAFTICAARAFVAGR
jgi:hypothetical protein